MIATNKDVEFQQICYTVPIRKNFVQEIGRRTLLNGVSGTFRNGELSAIMGPSGAGKSSLLNAISGYRTSGVTGYKKINKRDSCYITQEDHHQPLLTVEELMHVACALKVTSRKSHEVLITEILENLNLNHRRNATAECLSGGERKRLSIALESVANPTIFFLDEPTSGLDEVTASQCIQLLKNLAKSGRTVVCTIHQPSATIFKNFDHIYVLAKGHCVYQGEPKAIIPFLTSIHLDCPKTYSPSDYIIELCDSNEGSLISSLSEITQNGKLEYTQINDNEHTIGTDEDSLALSNYRWKNIITPVYLENSKQSGSLGCIGGGFALLEKMKAFSKRIKQDSDSVSGTRQFLVLLHLMMKKILRNRIALWIQFIHHLMCGLMFGLIFYKAANQGERMFDHLKYCIGCILVIVYTQVMVPILSFPMEVKLVKKEFFNRWYSLTPYYMALTISRLPLQIFFNMIFLSFTYWMSGLPNELWRFMLFSSVGIITSFVAEGMGLAIGATFSITNGSAVGPLLIAPFLGLAIYGFDFAADIPALMYALMKLSYIRVGAVTLVLSVFGFNRPELDCNEMYCHFSDPKVLLRFLRVEKVSIWHEFGFLVLLLLFFRVMLFLSLKKRCRT